MGRGKTVKQSQSSIFIGIPDARATGTTKNLELAQAIATQLIQQQKAARLHRSLLFVVSLALGITTGFLSKLIRPASGVKTETRIPRLSSLIPLYSSFQIALSGKSVAIRY